MSRLGRQLRLLHITSFEPTSLGQQVTLLCKALPTVDYETTVCSLIGGTFFRQQLNDHQVRTESLNARRRHPASSFMQLSRWIRGISPDIVHVWDGASSAWAVAAARKAGVRNVVLSYSSEVEKNAGFSPMNRWASILASRIVFHQPTSLEAKPETKSIWIPNAIDTNRGTAIGREQFLQQLGLSTNARLVATVDSGDSIRSIKDFIWATELLHRVEDQVQLLVVGQDEGATRRDGWRLKRFAKQIRVEGSVRFIDSPADLSSCLQHAECFWAASKRAPSPCVIEAMAAGIPVIAPNSASFREIISTEENGILVRRHDRAAYSRKTWKLFRNRDLAKRLGDAGKEFVDSRFTATTLVTKLVDLYSELLKSQENRKNSIDTRKYRASVDYG